MKWKTKITTAWNTFFLWLKTLTSARFQISSLQVYLFSPIILYTILCCYCFFDDRWYCVWAWSELDRTGLGSVYIQYIFLVNSFSSYHTGIYQVQIMVRCDTVIYLPFPKIVILLKRWNTLFMIFFFLCCVPSEVGWLCLSTTSPLVFFVCYLTKSLLC